MVDPGLVRLSLAEAADLIQRREVSPVELLDAVLARIAAVDPRLNAFTTLVPVDEARDAARAAEREIAAGRYRGPLHGIPAGVKDLIDTAGLRTTYGSGMFRDHVPATDGAVPERLRAAGAIIVGKTATHEFGRGVTTNNYFFGPTLNPWNLDHVPGGSSGGAAAATAALLGPLHVGTDGGGSIRVPAAFCGVVGLKPTLGLISNRGHTGGGDSSFSVPGPLGRTVGLRIGTCADVLRPQPEAAVRAALQATLGRLGALGARLVEVRLPHHDLVLPSVLAMFALEGEVALEARLGDRPRVFSPEVARLRAAMRVPDAAGWVSAQRDRQLVGRDYAAAFAEVDALVLPAVPFTAPRLDSDETRLAALCTAYTGAANLAGLPAVALPAGTSGGLPIGMQIVAPGGGDGLALRIARALEKTAAEHRVHPPPDGG
ncbi:MAG: amidase [Chloroflexi bacterium]|nr:MAG: amidase [Chloroflexota bacterium]